MLNPSIAYGKNKAISNTIAENNLEQPSSLVIQQSTSDTNQALFKNIDFPSTTQSTNLTAIFKKVENSVVQITAKTPNPLITYIDLHKSIGDNVGLTVNRHGQMMNLNLVLQARPLALGNVTSQESILP